MLCLSERKISALIFQSLNISMTVKNQYLLGSFFNSSLNIETSNTLSM